MGDTGRSFWSIIYGIIRLTRPINGILIFVAVLLGAYLATGTFDAFRFILGGIALSLISSAGYVINDMVDSDLDMLTKPRRPLVSGVVKPKEASNFAVLLYFAGIAISFYLGWQCVIVAVVIAGATLLYDFVLKGKGLWGNILVSAMIGSAFVYGWSINGGDISSVIFPATLAFLVNVGRELLKDAEDVIGDKAIGNKTVPVVSGVRRAVILALIFFVAVSIISPIPYFYGIYSDVYLWFLIPIDLLLLYYGIRLLRNPDQVLIGYTHRLLKVLMLLAIVGIWLGASKYGEMLAELLGS